MQLDDQTIGTIREALNKLGYNIRGGTSRDIFYIYSQNPGLFSTETYCLILEAKGWRVNNLQDGKAEQRTQIEAEILSTGQKLANGCPKGVS